MSYRFTKEDIKLVIKMWDTKNTQQIADEIGCKASSISGLASKIRSLGYKLERKHVRGEFDHLIKQALDEL